MDANTLRERGRAQPDINVRQAAEQAARPPQRAAPADLKQRLIAADMLAGPP